MHNKSLEINIIAQLKIYIEVWKNTINNIALA